MQQTHKNHAKLLAIAYGCIEKLQRDLHWDGIDERGLASFQSDIIKAMLQIEKEAAQSGNEFRNQMNIYKNKIIDLEKKAQKH